jgi:uncharacterized membrane protein YdbT with pleckstrin-like domain
VVNWLSEQKVAPVAVQEVAAMIFTAAGLMSEQEEESEIEEEESDDEEDEDQSESNEEESDESESEETYETEEIVKEEPDDMWSDFRLGVSVGVVAFMMGMYTCKFICA